MNRLPGRPRAVGWKVMASTGPTAALATAAALLLAGCSGSSGGNQVEDIQAFTLDKDTVDCKAAPDGSCDQITVYATPVHMERRDKSPLLIARSVDGAPGIPLEFSSRPTQLPDGRWQLVVHLNPDRPAGVYVGALHVDLDAAAPEGKQYRGARLSYRLEVSALAASATPLPAVVPGAAPWTEAPAGATRSGYVPVSLDASKFSRRWKTWVLGGTDLSGPGVPALIDGQILVPQARAFGSAPGPNALALSEQDGKPQWSVTIPGERLTGVIAAGDRAIWSSVQSTTPQYVYNAYLTNRSAGTQLGSRPLTDPNDPKFWLMTGNTLYLPDRSKGQMTALNLDDLQARWTVTAEPSPTSLLPVHGYFGATLADGVVYTHSGINFRAFRDSDGGQLYDVPADGGQTLPLKLYESQTPVIADANTVLAMDRPRYVQPDAVVNAGIQALSRSDGSVRWTVRQPFRGLPVTANGVLYAANQGNRTIEARSVADGSVLWSWPMDAGDTSWQLTMVLTDTHLFVSTDQRTIAIDLATHQAVWRHAQGGWLGMTQRGTLMIMAPNFGTASAPTSLTAIDLR